MKQTPQDKLVIERMAPGVLCRDGFLGTDTRSLDEILAADRAAVEKLGLTHERIAAALADALSKATAGLGRPVEISETVTAVYRESMGRIASPWPGEGVFAKGEMELTDSAAALTRHVTPLSVHLIAAHGFYQGRGSRYRLEPAELARLLKGGRDGPLPR